MTNQVNTPILLQVLKNEPCSEIPVWLMRQAGRYLPEYRALKEKFTFNQLSENPELAAEVTIQPLKRFKEIDAAILFADILSPAKALGFDFEFNPGPILSNPIKHPEDVEKLVTDSILNSNGYIFEALRIVKSYINEEDRNIKRAVLGFAATPWTLACYLIDQTPYKHHMGTKIFAYRYPDHFQLLLQKIANVTIEYLRQKHLAGADAVQLFDTWASLLSDEEYSTLSGKWITYIIEKLKQENIPVILYSQGSKNIILNSSTYAPSAISIDWRIPFKEMRDILPKHIVLQGNVDPALLFSDEKTIIQKTRDTYSNLKGRGVIANLGHGILQKTPIENVQYFLDAIKNM